MKKSKSIIILLLASILLSGCYVSVKPKSSDINPTNESHIPTISTTTYVLYDMVKQITKGCDINVVLLPNPETNPHTYQPSEDNYKTIKDSDVLVCIGGDMEPWTRELEPSKEELEDYNGVILVPFDSEMYPTEDEFADFEPHDNHYWLSIKETMDFIRDLEGVLIHRLSEYEDVIRSNAKEYYQKYEKLNNKLDDVIECSGHKHFVCADVFPFQHIVEEYGLFYTAFSADCDGAVSITQESIDTMITYIKEHKVAKVFYTDAGDPQILQQIIDKTGCEAYMLKTCHGVTKEEFDNELHLTDILDYNIGIFEKVLCNES